MTYATASDVIDRWIGPGAPSKTAQVETFIADATVIIDREFPDLATSDVTDDEIRLVVVAMVTRVYRNPEGIRSKSDASDGHMATAITWSGDNPGALELTDSERAVLRGASATSGPSAFTIDATPTADGGWIGPAPIFNPEDETIPW